MSTCWQRLALTASTGVLALSSFATNAYIATVKPETCGSANGELVAGLQGGTVFNPLTYAWSTGGTTRSISGLAAGSYSVTVTDAQGTEYLADVTLENVNELPIALFVSPSFTGMLEDLGYTGGACEATCNGVVTFPMVELGGTAPFNVSFDVPANNMGTNIHGHPMYGGLCALDVVNYTLTDAFGCSGSGMFNVVQIDNGWNPFATSTGACDGSDFGNIIVSTTAQSSHYDLTLYYAGEPVVGPIELWGGNTHTFEGLAVGMYELLSVPEWSQCATTQQVVVDDLGPGCAQISGTSWYDADADCVQDVDEVGVPGSVLLIQPGIQYAITGANGAFTFNLPAGNYTLAQADPYLDPYCPATMPIPFTVGGVPMSIDLANNSTAPLDVRIHTGTGNARPGFTHNVYVTVTNATVQPTGAVTVTLTLDPGVSYVDATPAPLVNGNVLTWSIADLDYFGSEDLHVQTTVPATLPLGTVLSHVATVSTAATDADLSNNTDAVQRIVAGSYDPNDKTALTSTRSSESLYRIDDDEWIDYTIRFQNTGTAEALFVTVTDTLPEILDMTSFQMGVTSHDNALSFKPDRVVEWYFNGINLPDSTSDEAGSQGFVKFRIKPQAPLMVGTVIENIANIYFDFNPPVITEPSVLVAEFSTGVGHGSTGSPRQLTLHPNPASEQLTITSDAAVDAITIVAADGREVLRHSLGTSSTTLDISGLASGSYLLIAILNNGSVARERFMKH